MRIALIRHGRTSWNAERRFLGRSDIPLDSEGHVQAKALAARIGALDAVYTSPLCRARETAACLGSGAVVVDDLSELDQGELEGMPGLEALGKYPEFFRAFAADPEGAIVPGGESLGACRDRALLALRELARVHADGSRIGVVTHQMVIASVTCTLMRQPLTEWRRFGLHNGEVVWIRPNGVDFDVLGGGPESPSV